MSHYREVCQYGATHGQCRCPDPNKTVRGVECDNPKHAEVVTLPDSETLVVNYSGASLLNPKPLVIGLTGFAGSGKDTVGAELVRRGWARVSFAEPVYALALAIDPAVDVGLGIYERLSDVVKTVGWHDAKWNYPDVRRILQGVGNEAREIIDPEVWVDLAHKRIKEALDNALSVVITDLRYPNEADMIRSLDNGFVVKVQRPGVGPINGHISDRGLSDHYIDANFDNDRTVTEIPAKVDRLFEAIR